MNRIKEAALIAIGIIALGLCIKSGLDGISNKDRKVTVKGLSEREVEADKVTWPILTKEIGDDLTALYTRINSTTGKVKAFLKQNGVKDSEISVNAPVVVDMSAERYGVQNSKYRYNITSTITVTSRNVKLVRSIIARQGELLKQGVAVVDGGYGNGVVYEYVSFQQMKPKMMQEAIKNAEQTAPPVRREQRQQAWQDSRGRAGAVHHQRPRQQHALRKEAARGLHRHLFAEGLTPTAKRQPASVQVPDSQCRCKRPSFASRKTAFWRAVCGLLHCKRPSIAF